MDSWRADCYYHSFKPLPDQSPESTLQHGKLYPITCTPISEQQPFLHSLNPVDSIDKQTSSNRNNQMAKDQPKDIIHKIQMCQTMKEYQKPQGKMPRNIKADLSEFTPDISTEILNARGSGQIPS